MISKIPGSGEVFDYFVDFETGRLESWEKIIPTFTYDKEVLLYIKNIFIVLLKLSYTRCHILIF